MLVEFSFFILLLNFFTFILFPNISFSFSYLFYLLRFNFYFITFIFFFLFFNFINLDFSISSIIENTNIFIPVLYKMGATWSHHEGSLFLYIIILTILFNYLITKKLNLTIEKYNLIFLLLFFFNSLFIFVSDAFIKTCAPIYKGAELNPILQDPLLIIHPPFLFIGFLGFIIPFIIVANDFKIPYLIYYVKLSWLFLTIGILLGSWWAYHELGWGGWWFWDPVENISLLPWLLGLIIFHNKDKPKLIKLTILTFFIGIFGSFFVRSGLVTSVHSFINDNSRGAYFIIFILYSLLFIKFNKNNYQKNIKDRINLYLNTIILLSIGIILLGTILPAIFPIKEISIGIIFYKTYLTPTILFIILLMSLAPFNSFKSYLLPFFLSIVFYFDKFIVLIINLIILIVINLFSIKNYRVLIGHLGFYIFVLGSLIYYFFSYNYINYFKPGDLIHYFNFDIIFAYLDYFKNANYLSTFGDFIISADNVLSPEHRTYKLNKLVKNKSAIYHSLFNDIYITITNGNYFEGYLIQINTYSGMILIWLSGLLLISSFFISEFLNKKKIKYYIK